MVLLTVAVCAAAGAGIWYRWETRLVRHAELAFAGGHLDLALRASEEYLSTHPRHPRSSRIAALCLSGLGHPVLAERRYTAATRVLRVQDYHLRVQALLQAKEYPLATEALTEALRRWPDDPRCLRNLAVIRTMEGKTEEAKRLANRLCQMPAHAAVGWAMLGTIYHRMHMSALTVECHLEALRLDPELQSVPEPIDFLKALALSLYETGQPEDSERFYLRALELQPEAETLRALGLLRSEAGDSDGAGRYWHQALELNPRYVPALTDLGALALSQGKVAEALEFYGRAVDYDPSSSTAHYGLGLAHERAGNTELAKIHCAKAEELR